MKLKCLDACENAGLAVGGGMGSASPEEFGYAGGAPNVVPAWSPPGSNAGVGKGTVSR